MSIQTSTYREVSLCSRCLPVCWINGELRIFSVDHFMFICKGCLGDRRVGTSSTNQIILPKNGKCLKELELSWQYKFYSYISYTKKKKLNMCTLMFEFKFFLLKFINFIL